MYDRFMIGINKDWTLEDVQEFSTRLLIAHELFHTWLGGMLRPPPDVIWFLEGFTDYASLWHASATDVVSQVWFVQRLGEFADSSRKSSLGKMACVAPRHSVA